MKTLRGFVDRIEGDLAVVLIGDTGREVAWPVSELPDGAGEGSVLAIEVRLDAEGTQAALEDVGSLIDRLKRGR